MNPGTASATRPRVSPHAGLAPRPAGARRWFTALLSLVVAASVMSSRYLFADSFYDLFAGRYILRHGFPHQNIATVTAHGAPWVDQQWLAHVLYYGAWVAGGYRALAALSAALVASGFAILGLLMLRRGVPPTRAFAWTLAAYVVCIGNTGIRAQSFAYPCFAIMLWLITDDDTSHRVSWRTWLLVPVLVVWANTHGSAVLGAAMVGLYAGYRVARALVRHEIRAVPGYLALGALGTATVVCTPYGIGVLAYYQRFVGNRALAQNVSEWAPPSPLSPFSWAFFAVLLAVVIAVVVAWRRGARPDLLLTGLAVILLALALTAVRNQAWFGLGGTLLAADTLARASGGRVPVLSRAFTSLVTAVLAGLALAAVVTLAVTPDSQFETQIPARAITVAATIAARSPGTLVLGDDYSGAPMLWLEPAMFGRVGFDVRLEIYSARELSTYCDFLFVRGPRWDRVTRGYDIVVASRRHPQLVRALTRLAGWRVVYQDSSGVVVVRRDAQPAGPP